MISPWSEGRLRPGVICPFCHGYGHHFSLEDRRPRWWRCQPCEGLGSPVVVAPAEIAIATAQNRFVKPAPENA